MMIFVWTLGSVSVISEKTIDFHYGKHHKGSVDTLNKPVAGTEFSGRRLIEIMKSLLFDSVSTVSLWCKKSPLRTQRGAAILARWAV